MAIVALKGNRKYHIAGGNDMRMTPRNGILETTAALCGRYVKNDVIESMNNVDDDDDPEALFCHKCKDKWMVRNPFG